MPKGFKTRVFIAALIVLVSCCAYAAGVKRDGGASPDAGVTTANVEKTQTAVGANSPEPITFPDKEKAKTDTDVVPSDVPTLESTAGQYDGQRGKPFSGPSIWRVLFSLAIVILMIVGVVWLLKQVWARGMRFDMKGRHIRVIDVVSLGMNRSVYLVAVGKKVVLLGSSDKGLSYLMEVNDLAVAEELPEGMPREGGVSFQGALENAAIQEIMKNQDTENAAGGDTFIDRLKNKLKKLDEGK